jgi:hypothetical protein
MFKQLKIYYILVSLPFALLLIGSAFFADAIKATIVRNPHPQINYAIFVIVLVGGVLVIVSAHRLIREARIFVEFSRAVRANTDWAALQKMASSYTGDISYLLQKLAASGGRSISHKEQAAIEHEHTAARNHLIRRNALPQYLTGLLVGMGLLGTFIGLLATLQDISVLISSFADLDMNNVSPILVFRIMIERMKAPMQSMGIAFSASMFGLLGSIVLGLMMVGIRRLQGDIFSVLGSEVARHIEIALSHEVTISDAINHGSGGAFSGDESRVLLRIEERLSESVRMQQRMLSAEIDDFQKQRADMLLTLAAQTEASNNYRSELQQLGRQLCTLATIMEKGNSDICSQFSELTVHLAAGAKESQKLVNVVEKGNDETSAQISELSIHLAGYAKESQKLLAMQVDEQKRLRDTLEKVNGETVTQISELSVHSASYAKESQKLLSMQVDEQKKLSDTLSSYKIEERLAEASRLQQKALSSEISDFQKQRADMLRILAEQTEATNNFRSELQLLGRQLDTIFNVMEKGNGEIFTQISELMVHRSADAKESHKLLAMQVTEQKRLIETLDSNKK